MSGVRGYYLRMSIERAIEGKIQEAMAAGMFSGLPGEGKPLPKVEGEEFAGDMWLGFKILRDGGMVPPWLMTAREIEVALEQLEAVDRHHAEAVALAAASGDWERYAVSLRFYFAEYEKRARAIRKKQEAWNIAAPGIRSQRPPIWVEHHLDRLCQRLREAGAPARLTGEAT